METEENLCTSLRAQPAKFSRYRSVRNAAANNIAPSAAMASMPALPSGDVKRSMSRYRKVRPQARESPLSLPDVEPKATEHESGDEGASLQAGRNLGKSTASFDDGMTNQICSLSALESPSAAKHAPEHNWAPSGGRYEQPLYNDSDPTLASAQAQLVNRAQQEAYDILTGEADRQKLLRRKQREDELSRRKLVEEQKTAHRPIDVPKSDEKARRPTQSSRFVDEEQRQRQCNKSTPRKGTTDNKAEEGSRVSRPVDLKPTNTRSSSKTRSGSEKQPSVSSAKFGPANPLPHFDAPVSAVNAGTRHVVVKQNHSSASLPVTPASTPVDVLLAARDALSADIELDDYMLLEAYKELGLERPLRRYEHVRDVMNSWDQDDQNALLLMPRDHENGYNLEVKDAPSEQPGDLSVSIYHSQKPGTWDKRWATLRSDGQVLIGRQNGSDMKNICHMSDFDIYIPTSRQVKKLKPPRKYCFAIKSQQKSAMFLSTANFVHFFATKDKQVATTWYNSVQKWRSWYMVHEMGLGQKTLPAASSTRNSSDKGSHKRDSSKLSSFQHVRAFEPLLFEDRGNPNVTQPSSTRDIDPVRRSPPKPFNTRGGPPVSFPKKLTKDISTGSPTTRGRGQTIIEGPPPSAFEDPFAPYGLLGRTYSMRQKAMQNEPSKPNETSQQQTSYSKVKPLIDLTQHHPEPPQHARKGHGIILDHIPAGGLVDAATSPENALPISQATSWRPSAGLDHTVGVRTKQPHDPSQVEEPFTKGLLAKVQEGQGGRARGRGVASGDRVATHPMLELESGSAYAPGSLLSNVERFLGNEAQPVDREKKTEVITKTGEVNKS